MAMSPRLLRPIQTGFDPRKIAGITAWFDASDDSVFTFNSGTVSEWRSKVGGFTATQAVALNQPSVVANWRTSRRAVRFSAAAQTLGINATWSNLGNNTAKTITEFYAVQWPTGSNQAFVSDTEFNGHKLFAYFGNTQSFYDAGEPSTARVFGNVGAGINSGVVITGIRNDATVTLFHGDTQIATRSNATGNIFASSAASTVKFNGASGGDAFLAQAITYSRALSTAEQSAVRSFLHQKYGL